MGILFSLSAFSVIGREGSTREGKDIVSRLWRDAESHLSEIRPVVKLSGGAPLYWGLMSDFSRSFLPWENDFSEGLYLAGFELGDPNLIPPEGWAKWDVPAQKYWIKEIQGDYQAAFRAGLVELQGCGYQLVGAVFDHTEAGKNCLYYPVFSLA